MLAREFRSTKWLAIPFYPAPGKNAAACKNNLGHKFMWEIGRAMSHWPRAYVVSDIA
jgi:hypothetical protein